MNIDANIFKKDANINSYTNDFKESIIKEKILKKNILK